ncbi:MAG: ABC transporter ATP-binding protein [Acidihalobacter sp.]|uniref:ABC transporter ATP-binding protein n=1 Tax=Acidihalobacter sp. TaxID=1872108 RepID=UPI00307D4C92
MTQALSIRNLKKVYRGGVEALRGIDLDVQEGDFFALLGPNGAGKSTTIGIISSLVNKSSGQVTVFGKDLDTQKAAAKTFIGLVPQEFNFNQFEPVEEVLINQAGYYGIERRLARERAERYLRELDLWEKRRQMARQLSGGQKRRLMIARALVHEPKLLILDEPTAGVDIEIRRSMWTFLREANARGTTIILTTHYLEEAENLCRNIAIIDHGEIVENTSMKRLLSKLDRETVVLDVAEELHAAPELPGYQVRLVDATTLEAEISRESSLSGLFAQLSDHGVHVTSMRNKSNRLEELFLTLVNDDGGDEEQSGTDIRRAG